MVDELDRSAEDFIQFALEQGVLKFGEFKLKSGRISPYFFNMGAIQSGKSLKRLGEFYAKRIAAEPAVEFDMILGPAYKGIPIASATAIAMQQLFNLDTAYAFNRKELKTHGEGGQFIGCPPKGKILIVDDVITAGTAVEEIMTLLEPLNVTVVGLLTAFDRQEQSRGPESATAFLAEKYEIPVFSIASFSDLMAHLGSESMDDAILDSMKAYRIQFGTKS